MSIETALAETGIVDTGAAEPAIDETAVEETAVVETRAPEASADIERLFLDYFESQGLETEPTAFDGRSDYGPFIFAGIPAGGLFTGAEEIKTPEQAAIYGGEAGEPYDPCYHLGCDDTSNLDSTALDQMSDAAAHATITLAQTKRLFPSTATAVKTGKLAGPTGGAQDVRAPTRGLCAERGPGLASRPGPQPATERRRNRTYPPPGYDGQPVLKTGWGTSPVPLRGRG